MEEKAHLTSARLPLWTLAICAGALLVFNSAELSSLLIYDRVAIMHGELWRLVTGNFVHFSSAHLFYNLAVFLVAGTLVEHHAYRFFPALCLASSILIGIALFVFEPAIFFYAGLSGVASAAVSYLCLQGLSEKGMWRWLCAATLAGLAFKTVLELALGKFFLLSMSTEIFTPIPLSHLVGIGISMILYVLLYWSSAMRPAKVV